MKKITATGTFLGFKTTVEVIEEKGTIKVLKDGIPDPYIRELMKEPPALGGTYYPDPDSLLGAYAVLTTKVFDHLDEIKVKGFIGQIPFKKKRIY